MVDELPDIAAVDLRAEPPGSWLLQHVPWRPAEQRISAGNADQEIAGWLRITVGAAGLLVERRTKRAGAAITTVSTWFPGDLQKLAIRFAPARSGNASFVPGSP